jgi:hypothetical protein
MKNAVFPRTQRRTTCFLWQASVANGEGAREMLMAYGAEKYPDFPAAGLACPNPQVGRTSSDVCVRGFQKKRTSRRTSGKGGAVAGADAYVARRLFIFEGV